MSIIKDVTKGSGRLQPPVARSTAGKWAVSAWVLEWGYAILPGTASFASRTPHATTFVASALNGQTTIIRPLASAGQPAGTAPG